MCCVNSPVLLHMIMWRLHRVQKWRPSSVYWHQRWTHALLDASRQSSRTVSIYKVMFYLRLLVCLSAELLREIRLNCHEVLKRGGHLDKKYSTIFWRYLGPEFRPRNVLLLSLPLRMWKMLCSYHYCGICVVVGNLL